MIARLLGYLYLGSIVAALALSGCQTTDTPEAKTFLVVRLDDSLKQYDRVLVQVFDRTDTAHLLQKLWDDRLSSPKTDIPEWDMSSFGTDYFIIKVTGFKAGDQVALRTRIFYEPPPGHPTVLHETLQPLKPRNWLASLVPSVGALSPDFQPDSLRYQVKMPVGKSALNFTMTGAYPGALIQMNGDTVVPGVATKTIQIGNSPDTVLIRATDRSTGTASTRNYQVIVFPTLPPDVYLANLVPSTGTLNTQFTSQNTLYSLYMPPNEDTVSFLPTAIDPATMIITIAGSSLLAGQRSQVITVAKGATLDVPIYVTRGSTSAFYQITLDHTQRSSH